MNHISISKQLINGVEVNSVMLRDLHKNLGVKSEFANWFKNQKEILEEYSEGVDYIRTVEDGKGATVIVKDGLKLKGKQSEYVITLDMAKHLCMLSRTKKGKEVRKYFIDIEKQHNSSMIKSLSEHQHKIQSLLAYTDQMGEVVTEHDKRISNLEKNSRLEAWQEKALQDAKNKKVYELAGDDKKLASQLHRKVWQLFKKRFHLPRYNELRQAQYDNGLEYIYGLTMAEMIS